MTAAAVTLDEFDAWYNGLSLAQVDDKFKQETLAQHDDSPLRK